MYKNKFIAIWRKHIRIKSYLDLEGKYLTLHYIPRKMNLFSKLLDIQFLSTFDIKRKLSFIFMKHIQGAYIVL